MMDSSLKKPDKTKSPRHTHEVWELQKSNIERLYVTEARPLSEVIQILKRHHDFVASEKQIKSRLPKWGLDVKNLKRVMIVELARTKAKRAAVENKKSSFRINKKPVDDRKIDRYLQRNNISEDELLIMASPVDAPSPGFSVFTPESARSSTPPPPNINFQTLSLVDLELNGPLNLLPTMAEEVIDSHDLQASSEHNAPHTNLYAQESLVTDKLILFDEFRGYPLRSELRSKPIAPVTNTVHRSHWSSSSIEEDAARRHNVSHNRFLGFIARVSLTRIRHSGHDCDGQCHYLWSCDSCGQHGGMSVVIDHCPGCAHLRCPMCPVEKFSHIRGIEIIDNSSSLDSLLRGQGYYV